MLAIGGTRAGRNCVAEPRCAAATERSDRLPAPILGGNLSALSTLHLHRAGVEAVRRSAGKRDLLNLGKRDRSRDETEKGPFGRVCAG